MREYSLFRHMGSEYLARALSEDNKRYRQKNLSVNIKIACFTWLLEFSVGVSVIIFWLLAGKHHQNLLRLINWIIIFIILPLAYILNREVTKQKVKTKFYWYFSTLPSLLYNYTCISPRSLHASWSTKLKAVLYTYVVCICFMYMYLFL